MSDIVIDGEPIDLSTLPDRRLGLLCKRFQRQMDQAEDTVEYTDAEDMLQVLETELNRRQDNPVEVTEHTQTPLERYEAVKAEPTGTSVACPECNKIFKKRHPAHVFCTNGKTTKGGNCKDRFWNQEDPERKKRHDYRIRNLAMYR